MGEGTSGLTTALTAPSTREPAELQREADAIRRDLDLLLAELDRRRHHLGAQLERIRRAALPVAFGAAALVGLAFLVGSLVRRAQGRHHRSWGRRLVIVTH